MSPTKRKILAVAFALLGITVTAGAIHGRSTRKCDSLPSRNYPTYRIASKGYTAGAEKTLLVYVSVDRKVLERESMKKLAQRLKNDFCREQAIQIVIFDRYKIARRFVPHSHSPTYEHDMKSIKGGYFLNRATGEEYISFVPSGSPPKVEEKIVLTESFDSRGFGQNAHGCDTSGFRKPNYKVASISENETLGLAIVLKPKIQTDAALIELSKYFKAKYCNYSLVIVTVFDNKKDAREFSVYDVKQIPDTPRAMYYLDRKSGKEKLVRIKVVDNKQIETPIELN